MREIPLKLKYTSRKDGGRFKSKSSTSGKAKKSPQGNGIRRRAYGPFNTF